MVFSHVHYYVMEKKEIGPNDTRKATVPRPYHTTTLVDVKLDILVAFVK